MTRWDYIRRQESAGYPGSIACESVGRIEHKFSMPVVSQMLSLTLLGGSTLARDGETLSGPAVQHRRLALFSILAGFRTTGLSREKLSAYFWPEEDRERARHFLADSVFTIRKALGKDVVLTVGADMRLNPEVICIDLWMFQDACARRDFASAAALYKGPFLDGFFISDAPDFERWVDTERERLGKVYADCLEGLAQQFENVADYSTAAEWWRRLAVHDPYSSRIAVRTMEALAKAGDCAAALKHAAKYDRLIKEDLDLTPDRSVIALVERLRSRSPDLADEKRSGESVVPGLGVSVVPRARARVEAAQEDSAQMQVVSYVREPDVLPVRGARHYVRRYGLISAAMSLTLAVILFGFQSLRPSAGAAGAPASRVRSSSPRSSDSHESESQPASSRALHDPNISRSPREEAADLSHRGRLAFSLGPPHGFSEGMSLFQKAIAVDSTFAPAYAGLADGYNSRNDWPRAKEAAIKAVSLDSTAAEGWAALAGVLAYGEHRWWAADSALQRAIELSPHFTLAHMKRAYIYAALGREEEALASAERGRVNDPESWNVLYNRGLIEFAVNRPKEAIPLYEAALALKPDELSVKMHLAWAYRATGQDDAASALVRTMGENPNATILAGEPAAMKAMLDQFEKGKLKLGGPSAATLYAWLGNNDAAFEQLKKSIWADKLLPLHMRQEPLVRLKSDPRYPKLMADLGLD